jgi:hypothetical protein
MLLEEHGMLKHSIGARRLHEAVGATLPVKVAQP